MFDAIADPMSSLSTMLNAPPWPSEPLAPEIAFRCALLSGERLDGVRVFFDSPLPGTIGARAFAFGSDIHVGRGHERHLAHEAWHVVQHRQGRVAPTSMIADVALNESDELEREAEAMAPLLLAKAALVAPRRPARGTRSGAAPVLQAFWEQVDVKTPVWNPAAVDLRRYAATGATQIKDGVPLPIYKLLAKPPAPVANYKPWLVFGTDGRTQGQIATALDIGYRTLACAESYRNDAAVVGALAATKVDRSAVEIIYKFETFAHLDQVFQSFGVLDALLIHNVALCADLPAAWRSLQDLKRQGRVLQIGVGNVDDAISHAVRALTGIDVVENSTESAMSLDSPLKDLPKATLYYYKLRDFGVTIGDSSSDALDTVIALMTHHYKGSRNVTSSSEAARQLDSFTRFALGASGEAMENYVALEKVDVWQKTNPCCTTNGPEVVLGAAALNFIARLGGDADTGFAREYATYRANHPGAATVAAWLEAMHRFTANDLDVGIPPRIGMKKKYVGLKLGAILSSYFGDTTCDKKLANEQLAVFTNSVADWTNLLHPNFDYIVC